MILFLFYTRFRKKSKTLYTEESLQNTIKWLKERGFKDPIKIISSYPTILGLGFDNIDNKIKWLKERGFKDPIKMIVSDPTILGYWFDNIDDKIKLLNKIIKLYKLNFTAIEAIENNLNILGSKIDKLWVLVRIIKEIAKNSTEVNNQLIYKLIFSNVEEVILASRSKVNLTLNDLLLKTKNIKKEKISKDKKYDLILKLPEKDKVRIRYFRGYKKK